MDGLNGPKGNNFDESYAQKAIAYNTLRSDRYFLQQRAEFQTTQLAVIHGLYSGCVYGGGAGLISAIYTRKMRQIPKGAALVGIPYAAFLGISTIYRLDI